MTTVAEHEESRRGGIPGPFWTPANGVTLLRVPLAVGAAVCLAEHMRLAAMALMAASFLTDAIDGAVARMTHSESEWGKVLDPLADKVVFLILGMALVLLDVMPLWFLVAIAVRDLGVGIGGLWLALRRGLLPSSNVAGKLSTTVLALYMIRQAFWPATTGTLAWGLDWLGWLAAATLLVSTAVYFVVGLTRRSPYGPPR